MNNIRLAKKDDLIAVLTIVRNDIQDMDSKGIFQWDDIYPDKTILQDDIEKQQMYVIEEDSYVVGFMTLNEQESPEYYNVSWAYKGKVLVVHRLAVNPEHHGKRYASQLMTFAERQAKNSGYEAIRLDAFINNPAAVMLYKNRGYRNAGIINLRKGLFYCYEWPAKN